MATVLERIGGGGVVTYFFSKFPYVNIRLFVQCCFNYNCVILRRASQHSVECVEVNGLITGLNATLQCCYIAKAVS
jgi:hypothetical protein